MRVFVDCYGASARWCGGKRLTLDLADDATVANAFDAIAGRYAEFAERRKQVAAAVGDVIAPPTQRLVEGGALALIPPVSGG